MNVSIGVMATVAVMAMSGLVSGYSYADSRYYYNEIQDSDVEERTGGGVTLDSTTIYNGVFQPENMIIHIVQNLVNFVASTMTWGLLMTTYQAPVKRKKRSSDLGADSFFPHDEEESRFGLNIDGDNVAWVLRQLASTAEQYKRLNDEL